jgi:hypothetical protein
MIAPSGADSANVNCLLNQIKLTTFQTFTRKNHFDLFDWALHWCLTLTLSHGAFAGQRCESCVSHEDYKLRRASVGSECARQATQGTPTLLQA